jgi:hypothetical protein
VRGSFDEKRGKECVQIFRKLVVRKNVCFKKNVRLWGQHKILIFFKKSYHPKPRRDSISRPIAPISLVAGGGDTTRGIRKRKPSFDGLTQIWRISGSVRRARTWVGISGSCQKSLKKRFDSNLEFFYRFTKLQLLPSVQQSDCGVNLPARTRLDRQLQIASFFRKNIGSKPCKSERELGTPCL